MKKILILNYEFPPIGGGGGRVSYTLAKGFMEKGFNVDVITSHYHHLPKFEMMQGIHVHRVSVFGRKEKQTATFLSMFWFLVSAVFIGIKLCLRNRYSFINTHFVLPTGPLGFLLSKLFCLTNVLSIHGGDIYDPSKTSSPHKNDLLRRFVRFLLNQADFVVAQSSDTKNNAIKYYRPSTSVEVIPLSYEPFHFSPATRVELQLSENKTYLIAVGRLVKRKGFDYLVKSLNHLPEDYEVLIAGDGLEKDALVELTQSHHLAHRVHFLGEISEELKFKYLSVSDIYVLSSLHEGFGIVLQEAMQVGLPIVSANHGGQVDIIINGVNGFLVKPGSETELASAVMRLKNNGELMKRISSNNVKAIDGFKADAIVDRYLSLLSIQKRGHSCPLQ